MKNITFILLLCCTAATFTNCNVNKRLAPYTDALTEAANADWSAERKTEVLALTLTKAFRESLVFTNPKKTVQFIDRFSQQNERNIEKIIGDLDDNLKGMNLLEKGEYFVSTARKPYIRELRSEVKKVERRIGRKINTFTIVGRFFNFLNPLKK